MWIRLRFCVVTLAFSCLISLVHGMQLKNALSRRLQPEVITIEQRPARRSAGIIALPEGSLWCKGNPTAWFPGHHNFVSSSNVWNDPTGF